MKRKNRSKPRQIRGHRHVDSLLRIYDSRSSAVFTNGFRNGRRDRLRRRGVGGLCLEIPATADLAPRCASGCPRSARRQTRRKPRPPSLSTIPRFRPSGHGRKSCVHSKLEVRDRLVSRSEHRGDTTVVTISLNDMEQDAQAPLVNVVASSFANDCRAQWKVEAEQAYSEAQDKLHETQRLAQEANSQAGGFAAAAKRRSCRGWREERTFHRSSWWRIRSGPKPPGG